MTRVTLIIMGVMVPKKYKKNYVICRNPIYSSQYTLYDKQNKYPTTTAKTLEKRTIVYMRPHDSA